MKILIIAPHPDDEVLGCGGTIIKHSQKGDDAYLCIVTKGYGPDWSEQYLREEKTAIKKSNSLLGIKKTYFLDFLTAKLDTFPQKELNDSVFKVVKEVKPEIIFLPHPGDLNKDHRLVFEAGMFAAKPVFGSSVKKVLCYEVLSETEWGSPLERNFIPNTYIDISDVLKDKLKAMSCYGNELKEYPHPRSLEAIEALAKKRGAEAGLKASEAFALIREII